MLSARPEILVDEQGRSLVDPTLPYRVGIPGPWGRERVVTAIPTNEAETGPALVDRGTVLVDSAGRAVVDPGGDRLGVPPLWVHRMLWARWVQDTRRLP